MKFREPVLMVILTILGIGAALHLLLHPLHATPPVPQPHWELWAFAVDATTGQPVAHERVNQVDYSNPVDCVKVATSLGPIPVHENVAIMFVCHKAGPVEQQT